MHNMLQGRLMAHCLPVCTCSSRCKDSGAKMHELLLLSATRPLSLELLSRLLRRLLLGRHLAQQQRIATCTLRYLRCSDTVLQSTPDQNRIRTGLVSCQLQYRRTCRHGKAEFYSPVNPRFPFGKGSKFRSPPGTFTCWV